MKINREMKDSPSESGSSRRPSVRYLLEAVVRRICTAVHLKIFHPAVVVLREPAAVSEQLGVVDERLGRRAGRQLAHVGGRHRRVHAVGVAADAQGEKVAAELRAQRGGVTNEVRQPRLDLEKIRKKLVDAESVEHRLDGFRVITDGQQGVGRVAPERRGTEEEAYQNRRFRVTSTPDTGILDRPHPP